MSKWQTQIRTKESYEKKTPNTFIKNEQIYKKTKNFYCGPSLNLHKNSEHKTRFVYLKTQFLKTPHFRNHWFKIKYFSNYLFLTCKKEKQNQNY